MCATLFEKMPFFEAFFAVFYAKPRCQCRSERSEESQTPTRFFVAKLLGMTVKSVAILLNCTDHKTQEKRLNHKKKPSLKWKKRGKIQHFLIFRCGNPQKNADSFSFCALCFAQMSPQPNKLTSCLEILAWTPPKKPTAFGFFFLVLSVRNPFREKWLFGCQQTNINQQTLRQLFR